MESLALALCVLRLCSATSTCYLNDGATSCNEHFSDSIDLVQIGQTAGLNMRTGGNEDEAGNPLSVPDWAMMKSLGEKFSPEAPQTAAPDAKEAAENSNLGELAANAAQAADALAAASAGAATPGAAEALKAAEALAAASAVAGAGAKNAPAKLTDAKDAPAEMTRDPADEPVKAEGVAPIPPPGFQTEDAPAPAPAAPLVAAAASDMLFSYRDMNGCGALGANANSVWCDDDLYNCHKTVNVASDVCPSGVVALVSTQGFGTFEKPIIVDGCAYAYVATYTCADIEAVVGSFSSVGFPSTNNGNVFAYWDHGQCGISGQDANWEWCGKEAFDCKPIVTVPTETCSTGEMSLLNKWGTGDYQMPVVFDGCKYAYFAEYSCRHFYVGTVNDPTVDTTNLEAAAAASSVDAANTASSLAEATTVFYATAANTVGISGAITNEDYHRDLDALKKATSAPEISQPRFGHPFQTAPETTYK